MEMFTVVLTVFEAEKVHDFIRNEIKAKRYKGGNT